MGKRWNRFCLLMWKNWTLQYRKPLQTTVEIIAPILFSVLLVVLRSLVDPKKYPTHIYPSFNPLPLQLLLANAQANNASNSTNNTNMFRNYTLVYSPSPNKILDRSMHLLDGVFKGIKGYKNSKKLVAHFASSERNRTFAGLQFSDDLYGKENLPRDLELTIRFPGELRSVGSQLSGSFAHRDNSTSEKSNHSIGDKLEKLLMIRDWKTNLLYPFFQKSGPREPEREHGAQPAYYDEGFLTLQEVITLCLILGQLGVTSMKEIPLKAPDLLLKTPTLLMRRFPYANWRDDPLLIVLIQFVGLFILLSFIYTCINTVKSITLEREKQLKEAMKVMGLPNWLHWTAWFIKSFTFLLISAILIIILFKVHWYQNCNFTVFTNSDALVLFLFFIIYICSVITFCFAVSVFFSKANTAATVAGLIWFLTYFPFFLFQSRYESLTLTIKLVASLGLNTAMSYGLQIVLMFESSENGIHWDNIWKTASPDDNLTLGLIMVMLIVDSTIYLIIALYVEAVFPGEYGTRQPWYFPFTYAYWCGLPKKISTEIFDDSTLTKNDNFETDPNLKAEIQIVNLCKVFRKKPAVKNLTLNIYQDQITVLLGHNGAGKTTTMSMLTGIIPPTSGTAYICGYDIRTNMNDIRANLGLCPQHNILFDNLTVKEHIYFFSRLKGVEKAKMEDEIKKYVQLMNLDAKINKRSKTLSGGMKRKLCVAIALCGDSKIVLLDEPTAGMDPSSRRNLWNLLQMQKQGRCVLLTTHYMDEADILGDRIAIMANGELKCCGSSFFLKKKYSSGYRLVLEKAPKCDTDKITQFLKKYIPDIQVHRNVASELTYMLNEDHIKVFETMLKNLEAKTEELGIRSYGISQSSLEEVFDKVGADRVREESSISKTEKPFSTRENSGKNQLLTGCHLILNQFAAMLMKRVLSIMRAWLLLIIQIIIPVAFLIMAIAVIRSMKNTASDDLPKRPLTLDSYEDPVTLVVDSSNWSQMYLKSLKKHKVSKVHNITKTMLDLTKNVPVTVRKQYIVGASFEPTRVTAYFNNDPYHSPPLALGLVLDAFYKKFLGSNHSITFVNHPLPFTTDTKFKRLLSGKSLGFHLAFNITFSMALVSSFYVLFYVRERVCRSKHLQFASGVKGYVFWTAAFVCDLSSFFLTSLALLITLICFQEEGFRSSSEIGRLFLIISYFGFAMLPLMYVASYLFEAPASGFTRMTLFSVLTGAAAFVVVQILYSPGLNLKHIGDAIHWWLLAFPHYCLATSIQNSYVTFSTAKACDFFVSGCVEHQPNLTAADCWNKACNSEFFGSYCCVREPKYFQWKSPGIGRNLFYSLVLGSILFLLLIVVEYKLCSKSKCKCSKNRRTNLPQNVENEDEDVSQEKQKIRGTSLSQLHMDYILVTRDLTKYYKNFLAVNGLCLGVKQFECFGLLGINGAGKTSTFRMLTGDLSPSYGEAWICGFNIETQLKGVQKFIGYCPQFDALLIDLTPQETLTIFALLRGIPLSECKYVAEKLAVDFDFLQHLHKRVKQLSGGNKRKLSTAISLIGDPPMIFLDEPTAGMDPTTKRHLWNALCINRDNGKCIVFTSHSMEECEALCTRLAIMVNGNLQCLGSIQRLKNKFATGFTLTIKMKRVIGRDLSLADVQKIENYVKEKFPTAVQKERHQELITFNVSNNVRWSEIFKILEQAKTMLNIEDYSLEQSSLEQIFLSLTESQK